MYVKPNLLQKTLGKILEAAGFNVTLHATADHYTADILAKSSDITLVIDCLDSAGYVGAHTLIYNLARKQKIFRADHTVLAFYNVQPSDHNVKAAEEANIKIWGKQEIDALFDVAFEYRRIGKNSVLDLLGPAKAQAPEQPAQQAQPRQTHASTISLNRYVSTAPWRPDMDYIVNHVFTLIFHQGLKKIDGLKSKKGHFLAYRGKKPPYVLHSPVLSDGVKYNIDEIDSLLDSIKLREGEIDYLLAYTHIGSDLLKIAEKHNVRCVICDSIERKGILSREPVFAREESTVYIITTDDLVDYIKKIEKR